MGVSLKFFLWLFFLANTALQATAAQLPLTDGMTREKMNLVFHEHCLYRELSQELVQRQLLGILDELDPSKAYFISPEVDLWIHPQDDLIKKLYTEWSQGNFSYLKQIEETFVKAIHRRKQLEETIVIPPKSGPIERESLRTENWPQSTDELKERLTKIACLQHEILESFEASKQPLIERRIKQFREEEEARYLNPDPLFRHHGMLQSYLHAFAASLDGHTIYFTPDEAREMVNSLHRKVTGIGVMLSEELDGYKIVRIVESSPAAIEGSLQVGDMIIAVDNEPTLGLGLNRGVLLIQGTKGSKVKLSLQRPAKHTGEVPYTFEISLKRDDIVLQERRFHVQEEAFGDGKIAILSLYSFYHDQKGSCGEDLRREISTLKQDGKLRAVILDLRSNLGGVLITSPHVCGLFIHPSLIVSVSLPNHGGFSRLRLLDDNPIWDGPVIVLVNKASASCSEIVAGTLQDLGRALIVGDPETYGKGSYQTFTFRENHPDPYGDFTITEGIYYTVSGRSPQLTGIQPDIIVAGPMADLEIGESILKHPLSKQQIAPGYDDSLDDVGFLEKQRLQRSYLPRRQARITENVRYLDVLKANSRARLTQQNKLKEEAEQWRQAPSKPREEFHDAQLQECLNIVKDWIFLRSNPAEKINPPS